MEFDNDLSFQRYLYVAMLIICFWKCFIKIKLHHKLMPSMSELVSLQWTWVSESLWVCSEHERHECEHCEIERRVNASERDSGEWNEVWALLNWKVGGRELVRGSHLQVRARVSVSSVSLKWSWVRGWVWWNEVLAWVSTSFVAFIRGWPLVRASFLRMNGGWALPSAKLRE